MKLVLALCIALLAILAWADPVKSQVVVEGMQEEVRPLAPPQVAVSAGADGTVEVRILPTANVVRPWRFWMRTPGVTETIELQELASGVVRGVVSADALVRGTWSPRVDAGALRFTLPQGTTPEIRLIAWPVSRMSTQTPIGALNLDRVADRPMPFNKRVLTRAVGHLSVLPKTQEIDPSGAFFTYCTAFLIASDTAMTAGHCVENILESGHAELVLGYVSGDAPDGRGRHSVTVAFHDRDLDFALLKLDPPANPRAVFAIAETEPSTGTKLAILQHFAGEPMSISDDADCVNYDVLFNGPSSIRDNALHRRENIAFGHGCDTTKSSSGAPVLDRETMNVVGLHQRGYRDGTHQPINRALRVQHLHAALAQYAEQAASHQER